MSPGTLRGDVRTWGYIGVNSFGGPAGQIAVLHRVVVDEKQWVDEKRFLHALNFCMLLPGPEAMQLATYLGWLRRGVGGGLLAGGLFVLPGALVMLLIAAAYALYGDVNWISGLLFGVQTAVIAIIAQAVVRIGRRALKTRTSVALAVASFTGVFVFGLHFPVIVAVALAIGWVVGRMRPSALDVRVADDATSDQVGPTVVRQTRIVATVVLVVWAASIASLVVLLGRDNVFAQEAVVFAQAAIFSFGGAYAVLGFVTQQAVVNYGWLSTGDMVTGLGLAETTPGPLILVCQFVGFLAAYQAAPVGVAPLLAGVLGALVTVWVLFLPSFVLVFAGAPHIESLRHDVRIAGSLAAVTAAVVGVIADLGLWFAVNVLFDEVDQTRSGVIAIPWPAWGSLDLWAAALAALAAVLVFWRRMGILPVLGVCAGLGMLLSVTGVHAA
ncbi:MAG: chromate efflux transporter [Actinomycetes bacterium]